MISNFWEIVPRWCIFFINKNIDITFADSIMHTEKTTLYFPIVNVDFLSWFHAIYIDPKDVSENLKFAWYASCDSMQKLISRVLIGNYWLCL